jgi:hypothetical protein
MLVEVETDRTHSVVGQVLKYLARLQGITSFFEGPIPASTVMP